MLSFCREAVQHIRETRFDVPSRGLAVPCLVAVLSLSAGCDVGDPESRAQRKADEFFKTFSIPSPSTEKEWGIRNYHVFHVWPTVALPDSDAGLFRAVIPFWCEGEAGDGTTRKFSRELAVYVKLESTGPRVLRYHFEGDTPLSWGWQWIHWFALVLALPVVARLSTFLQSFGNGVIGGCLACLGVAIMLALPTGLFLAGLCALCATYFLVTDEAAGVFSLGAWLSMGYALYVGWFCFGSLAGAVSAVLAYVVLWLFVIRPLIGRWVRKRYTA
jgi:hypothetical protein